MRCVCDGSTRSGQVRILAKTYANCVDQSSAHLFYAVAAAKNLLVYGADISNAFAKASPPKQLFYIRPDCAFNEWWVQHKNCPPIPSGQVIPILLGLWEKHVDEILREIGLTPTVHKPCLYSGVINDNRVLFMRQVDDFAIATLDEHTSEILMDMIDDKLKIPIKRQGYLDMYNGVDVLQTCHYIKLNVKTFIDKVFKHHISTWMKTSYPTPNHSTPFLTDTTCLKKFNAAIGNPDKKIQSNLAKNHATFLPIRRRQTHMGDDNMPPQPFLYQRQTVAIQHLPAQNTLPWPQTCLEILIQLLRQRPILLVHSTKTCTPQRPTTVNQQQSKGHPPQKQATI